MILYLPSGKLTVCYWSHGPVEIVDLPSQKMGGFSIVMWTFTRGYIHGKLFVFVARRMPLFVWSHEIHTLFGAPTNDLVDSFHTFNFWLVCILLYNTNYIYIYSLVICNLHGVYPICSYKPTYRSWITYINSVFCWCSANDCGLSSYF